MSAQNGNVLYATYCATISYARRLVLRQTRVKFYEELYISTSGQAPQNMQLLECRALMIEQDALGAPPMHPDVSCSV